MPHLPCWIDMKWNWAEKRKRHAEKRRRRVLSLCYAVRYQCSSHLRLLLRLLFLWVILLLYTSQARRGLYISYSITHTSCFEDLYIHISRVYYPLVIVIIPTNRPWNSVWRAYREIAKRDGQTWCSASTLRYIPTSICPSVRPSDHPSVYPSNHPPML